jgi:Rhodopirellula transposase DDE domain
LRKEVVEPDLLPAIDSIIEDNTAGNPMKDSIWTHLTVKEITDKLGERGIKVSMNVVKHLLRKIGLGSRKMSKKIIMKENIEGRNEQFEKIKEYKAIFLSKGYAVLSVDTKKKELLGRFYRNGKTIGNQEIKCYDHDFPSFSSGKVVPFGIYDMGRNEGYLLLGESADTAEFNVACLRKYWADHGSKIYTNDEPLLILVDGGGSNASANRLYKQEMQAFADEIGRSIRIAHYPPYCSKYNPIEHRFFPFITRAWEGVILENVDTMVQLVEARTQKLKCGIKIVVDKIQQKFKKGVTVFDDYWDYLDIVVDEINPKLNYLLRPLNPNTTAI